jgi:thioredoxin reductase
MSWILFLQILILIIVGSFMVGIMAAIIAVSVRSKR